MQEIQVDVAIIGAGTVVLPGVEIGEGTAVGAQGLVTRSLEPWGVYAGCPVRRLKDRPQDLLEQEADMLKRGLYQPADAPVKG